MNHSETIPMENDRNSQSLAEEYAVYVQRIASQLIAQFGMTMDVRDDLVSAGYLGLVEAATRYEKTPDSKFSSFAYLRIRGAMIDHLRTNSSMPRGAFMKLKREERTAALQQDFMETGELDTLKDVVSFLAAGTIAQDILTNEDEYEAEELLEVERGIYREQLKEKFQALISRLKDKEALVIREHYFNGKSFREISEDFPELKPSWISRLHARALKRLSVLYAGEEQ